MKDKTLYELANRINEIELQRMILDIEYNQIIYEIWDRLPQLKGDPSLQLKKVKKVRK